MEDWDAASDNWTGTVSTNDIDTTVTQYLSDDPSVLTCAFSVSTAAALRTLGERVHDLG